MPLRSRRTASLNGSFRHSKTRVSGSMYFRHLRDAADHSKLDATGTTTSGHSVLWVTGALSNTERNNQARWFDCRGAFRITTDGRVIG
jgi:hypothetical protein